MEDGENELNCDANCCVQNLVLLYEGEDVRKYLEHHVANYKVQRRDISITLQEVPSSYSSFNAFNHSIDSAGEGLLDRINGSAEMSSSALSSWDGVVFPAYMTGALHEFNRLWDWNSYLMEQQDEENSDNDTTSNIKWMDIQPFFRSQAQRVDTKSTAGVSSSRRTLYAPLDGDVVYLYYRKDLFEKYQIQAPRTWSEYMDVAIFFHGKALGPNNSRLIGSCVASEKSDHHGSNVRAYWASLILSTMTQTKGTSSGFLLDPETIEPILGDAMEETLRILRYESTLVGKHDRNSDDTNSGDSSHSLDLTSCAMTYGWTNQLPAMMNDNFGTINNIGVAPTPGSDLVLNRTSGQLEACTPEICPYGMYYDDIGVVNRPSYSAFGGWVGGVSNDSISRKQHDMADFFSYISNPVQSLSDVLPNTRSNFISPYRYSHVQASEWVGAGFNEATASQYVDSIKEINSENTVSEIRIRPGMSIRKIIDEEVSAYLLATNDYENTSQNISLKDAALRSEITVTMDMRIRDAIVSTDREAVLKNYQSSLGFLEGVEDNSMNYIDKNYRDTGWGVATLICCSSIAAVLWVLWNQKKTTMQAFQPILLIQSAIGFFFMGATLVPLGFDDSLFGKKTLDFTCMATPWIYVFGYSIFFSSVYSKIQVCMEVYKSPGKYERMMVLPMDSLKLFCKYFSLNASLLLLWTIIDPLRWTRIETISYDSPATFSDGRVESYGFCMPERLKYPGFPIALLVYNLICAFIAMLQALRCRLLVLEYREMQWLQLCIVPFFEAWIIGGPVVRALNEQPTAQYVAFLMIISSSTIASAFAIFAPKEWYIRKNNIFPDEEKSTMPSAPAAPGVRVLKHPTLESQKHVSNLQNRLARYTSSNTELAIDIRVLQEKFRLLTEEEKLAVVGGIFAKEIRESQKNLRMETIMFDDDESDASDEGGSCTLSLHDKEPNTGPVNTIVGRNAPNMRISELSIDVDDLKQLRAEEGRLYSQTDDNGSFVGKGTKSIYDRTDSNSAHAEVTLNGRSEKEVSPDIQYNVLTEREDASLNKTGDSAEVAVNPIDGESQQPFGEVDNRTVGKTLSSSNHENQVEKDNMEDATSGITRANGFSTKIDELNQMIYSDNIRDLEAEATSMAEEFKMRLFLLEDISDVQCNNKISPEKSRNEMVQPNKTRALESETTTMAEPTESNNIISENAAGFQHSKHDGTHAIDISNATTISSTTVMTECGSKGLKIPNNELNESPSSTSDSDCPHSTVIAAAGESSGGHVFVSENVSVKKNGEKSRRQLAGEPSSDQIASEDNKSDKVRSDDRFAAANPLLSVKHDRPKTPSTEWSSLRSLGSSTSSSAVDTAALESPSGQSQFIDKSQTNSISINGWKAAGKIGSLIADISDSTSASSRGESIADSVSSLEIMPTPTNSKVQLAKDVEQLLQKHGFNAVKDESTNDGETTTGQKIGFRTAHISNTRLKKRELEAMRHSLRRPSS